MNTEPVLVLNANFEPLNICSMRRALGLMVTEKATLIANGRGTIQTINATYPRPSVIRLQNMVKRPRPVPKLTRREIFRRDHFTCQYCGKHTKELTIDHVFPRHLGGQHTWENVVAACPECNRKKGGKILKESGMELLSTPKAPPSSAHYIFGESSSGYLEWEPFLNGW